MARRERWEEAFDPPFEIRGPGAPGSAFVLASPHSGAIYPQDFLDLSRLPATALRRSEDAHVDALAAPAAAALGAPLIAARFPRAFLDVNREALELDPRLVEGPLPDGANTRSLRVAGGLGVAPRVVGDGLAIYDGRLTLDHVLDRVARLHAPYHQALDGLMAQAQRRFGVAILIDCHSMPALATQRAAGRRLDVVLGDRFGASADAGLVEAIHDSFLADGLRTARNKPYAGGYTTERHGRPRAGRHAIQIEIARDLYMDERTLERGPGFAETAAAVARACLSALAAARDLGLPSRLAAE
jgi:N-formylglutamate amidohydrolase